MLVAVAALAIGTVVPRPFLGPETPSVVRPIPILLFNNPIHTDIAIPIDASVLTRFGFLEAAGLPASHPNARWLIFGWGSRAFYISTPTWSELKLRPLAAALTVDRSVMHVLVRGALDETDPSVRRLQLSETQYQAILDFIDTSFTKDSENRPIPIPGAGYGLDDGFFEANGKFNVLVGCNTWTAAALRAAGLTTGWWNPLPLTLGWSLVLHNQAAGTQP
ncbi:TIGR02117 family protein [Mesorhizobium sp. NBSH29]|uniref:TIGR02117 family protein n=1 Tax=Mesorhizobium sp. NBSH29 TaxID=2654249 RepID=UPI0027E4F5F0|nr:TIGR02117 family protein [Mesorhizobium sp. NBSH29]